MKLHWKPVPAPLPDMQMWQAQDELVSYVVTLDGGCRRDDRFYMRYSVSAKMIGSSTNDLGLYDTLAQAQAAAESSRH